MYISGANGNEKYKILANYWIRNRQKISHRRNYTLYDLGGLNNPESDKVNWTAVGVKPPKGFKEINRAKPKLIARAIEHYNTPITWMDVDSLQVAHPIDMYMPHHVDFAVSYRGGGSTGSRSRYLNAGFVYAAYRAVSICFLNYWRESCPGGRYYEYDPEDEAHPSGDNRYLERIIFKHFPPGTKLKNQVKEVPFPRGTIKVKFLPAEEFNARPKDLKMPSKAKIVHFSGGTKQLGEIKSFAEKYNLI